MEVAETVDTAAEATATETATAEAATVETTAIDATTDPAVAVTVRTIRRSDAVSHPTLPEEADLEDVVAAPRDTDNQPLPIIPTNIRYHRNLNYHLISSSLVRDKYSINSPVFSVLSTNLIIVK